MKILHTSDWHLGHVLYNYDRRKEQQAMLDQMAEIVALEQPDVFLLAGDIYDSNQPSAAAQTMFSDAMVNIHQACPQMQIICISGNHDSSSRHMIFSTPFRLLNISMVGNIAKTEEQLQKHIFKIADKGYVVAVPYAPDRMMPEDLFVRLQRLVSEQNTDNLPVVLMAHLAVSGADFRGHENATDKVVGGLDCMNMSALGNDYDYVALGHIHHAQYIYGSDKRMRYSGTPIPVSFDEVLPNNEHSVTIVEIASHGDQPDVRTIAVDNPLPLVNLPTEGFDTWEVVEKQFRQFPPDLNVYIRLNVLVDGILPPSVNDDVRVIADTKTCRFCLINTQRKKSQQQSSGHQHYSIAEFSKLSKLEVVQKYFDMIGETFDEELETLFMEAERRANEDDEQEDAQIN